MKRNKIWPTSSDSISKLWRTATVKDKKWNNFFIGTLFKAHTTTTNQVAMFLPFHISNEREKSMKSEAWNHSSGGGGRNSVGREIHLSGNDGGAARRKNGFFWQRRRRRLRRNLSGCRVALVRRCCGSITNNWRMDCEGTISAGFLGTKPTSYVHAAN